MNNNLFDFIKNIGHQQNDASIQGMLNDDVYATAEQSIQQDLTQLSPSDLSQLQSKAMNDDLNSEQPQVQQITNNFSNQLSGKLGIQSDMAKKIGAILIPVIIAKLLKSSKQNNTNSSGGISDIFGSIFGNNNTNSNSGGIKDQLSQLGKKLGLDKDGDGDVDMDDLKKMF